jgi:hypothetical protein
VHLARLQIVQRNQPPLRHQPAARLKPDPCPAVGACIYTARDEAQMERLRVGLDLDLVVVCGRAERGLVIEAFCVN